MLRRLSYAFSIFLTLLACSQLLLAQTTSATILGTIKDDSGAVLPGVSVSVRHLDTGATRTVVTDDEGRYHALNLALGNYEVQAELSGFQTAVRSGIKLSVGQEAVVDFTMKVGEISEKVVVKGEAPLVETTTSTVTALVDDKKIRDLPLNGRDFSQLATLQAGVYAAPAHGQGITSLDGAGPRMSISGARPKQNNFLLDGSDVQDSAGRTPAGVSGTTLGVETVREFTVLTSIYSAEYGKVAGGVINAVTKSGTNELHGTLFEFLRNDNLDARNFFDQRKPEFKRNQFGFTVGGPVRKDRTFFFGSYEGLRDRLGLTGLYTTLTPEARQGIFPNRTVPVNPRVKPYLDLLPLPTPGARNFGDGRAEFIRSLSQPTNENYYLVKVDHNLSDSDSIFVRYLKDDSSVITQQPTPGFHNEGETRRQFTTIEARRVISPTLFNEFRFSFNRNVFGVVAVQTISLDPSLSFIPGNSMGQIGAAGVSYGYNGRQDRFLTQNMFEYMDNISYSRGRHSVRFGAQIKRLHTNTLSAYMRNASWTFSSIDAFLGGRAFLLDVMLPDSDTIRGWRQVYAGAYVQDDFKVKPTLTLNLGLRWEFSTEPNEVNGKVANLVHPLTDTEVSVLDRLYENPSRFNFSPRLGFAWDVFGNGKTAVRGGAGIFYNILLPLDWIFTATNVPPFFKRPLLTNPPGFPSVPEALASVTIPPYGLQIIETKPAQPYLVKYNLSIQREILPDLALSIGYTGSKGIHAGRNQNLNINRFEILPDGRKFFPVGARRFNPIFSGYALAVFDSKSLYNALQVSLNKRFSRGFQFQVSYTFSKSMDESAGNLGGIETNSSSTTHSLDPYDRSRDYSLSAFHVKNVVVTNFSYDLPVKATGVLGRLVGGWQVNGIVTLADGSPAIFSTSIDRSRAGNSTSSEGTKDRPNLRPGGNTNPVRERNPNNYWDGSRFELQEVGFFGNLGRNTGIVPGVASMDFSLIKNISTGEGRTLQFRSEFFNIFNRANFGLPSGTVFQDASGVPSATFGRITTSTTTARQIQLGLKFLF